MVLFISGILSVEDVVSAVLDDPSTETSSTVDTPAKCRDEVDAAPILAVRPELDSSVEDFLGRLKSALQTSTSPLFVYSTDEQIDTNRSDLGQ